MGTLGPADAAVFMRLAIALCIGLFIGLEREYSHVKAPAGIRTHALLGMLGWASALLAQQFDAPMILVGMLAVLAAVAVAGYVITSQQEEGDKGRLGLTSEVVLLLTFVLGAMAFHGRVREAVVIAGATNVILSAKRPMHRFVGAVSVEDWVACMKFAVVTLVILPVLPNAHFGPLNAFNPYKTWLLVVMIAAISFLGYVLTKIIGAERGVILTGLIGGLASSTAVTLANSKRGRQSPELAVPLALSTILACGVMLPRLALIVWALCPPVVPLLLPPYGAMLTVALAYSFMLHRAHREEQAAGADGSGAHHANPFELGSALKLAVAFAVVTLLVKWVQSAGAGHSGLYMVSFVAGLVETDAIIVTLAEQAHGPEALALAVAAHGMVLAAIANSVLKAGLSASVGGWRYGRHVVGCLALSGFTGALVTWLIG